MRRLNQHRLDAGYAISDLARLMRVNEDEACDWLCGRSRPTPEQQRDLARILNVHPQELDAPPPQKPRRGERFRDRVLNAGARLRY